MFNASFSQRYTYRIRKTEQVSMNRYPIPPKKLAQKLYVINSRFIASAGPAFSVKQARSLSPGSSPNSQMQPSRTGYLSAWIKCYRTLTRTPASRRGTAGRPALAVLKGAGLGDVVVVITRYFGGTKLGRVGWCMLIAMRSEKFWLCCLGLSGFQPIR